MDQTRIITTVYFIRYSELEAPELNDNQIQNDVEKLENDFQQLLKEMKGSSAESGSSWLSSISDWGASLIKSVTPKAVKELFSGNMLPVADQDSNDYQFLQLSFANSTLSFRACHASGCT